MTDKIEAAIKELQQLLDTSSDPNGFPWQTPMSYESTELAITALRQQQAKSEAERHLGVMINQAVEWMRNDGRPEYGNMAANLQAAFLEYKAVLAAAKQVT